VLLEDNELSKKQHKPRTAYYKIAKIGNNLLLSSLLSKAFTEENCKFPKPVNRHYIPVHGSEDFYVLNNVSTLKGMFFGELVFIEKDKFQTVIQMDDALDIYKTTTVTVDNVNIEGLNEKEIQNFKKEFVDSTLYFGVTGNHIAVIQSPAIKTKHLAEYLAYMLGEHQANLLSDKVIIFKDIPSEEAKKQQKKHKPKSVKISQHLVPNPKADNSSGQSANFSLDGSNNKLWDAITESLGLTNQASKKLKQNMRGDNFIVDIVLRIKGQTKDVSDSGQQLLDTISTSLSNLDDDDYEIEYAGGAKLTAGQFRLKKNIRLEIINNSVNHIKLMNDLYDFLEANISDAKE